MSLTHLKPLVEDLVAGLGLSPGYVVGVYHDGHQVEIAHGVSHVGNGTPMLPTTSWQAGSVTKVLTTTLLMRFIEAGAASLTDPVTVYLPELRIAGRAPVDMTLEMLVNHTNGIDADSLFPGEVTGSGAVASYVEALAPRGFVFPPGSGLTYSNPGLALAGRVIEVLAGDEFNAILKRDLYGPLGMTNAVTTAGEAILRNTAVGTYPEGPGQFRQSSVFMLPPAAAAAGTTPIVTVGDLLAFGRMHLNGGNGYLSEDTVAAMRTPTVDIATPGVPAFGLGWMLSPVAATTAVWHPGASYGGVSMLAIFPDLDLAVTAFGNCPAAAATHDAVTSLVLRELSGVPLTEGLVAGGSEPNLRQLVGTYATSDMEHRVTLGSDPGTLHIDTRFVEFDPDHGQMMRTFVGGVDARHVTVRHVRDRVFAPVELADGFGGLFQRNGLVSFHGPETPTHLHNGPRRTLRIAG